MQVRVDLYASMRKRARAVRLTDCCFIGGDKKIVILGCYVIVLSVCRALKYPFKSVEIPLAGPLKIDPLDRFDFVRFSTGRCLSPL